MMSEANRIMSEANRMNQQEWAEYGAAMAEDNNGVPWGAMTDEDYAEMIDEEL